MKIVVEGKADKNFLKQYIKEKLNIPCEFIVTGSNSCSIDNKVIELIRTQTDGLGYQTIFILDGDCPNAENKPDFETSRNCLLKAFEDFANPLREDSIFLFPNGESAGCLEDLLVELMTHKSQSIFDCYKDYQKCVEGIDAGYKTPSDLKTLLFIYSYATTGNGSETSRSYTNSEVWNLASPALTPLLNFLKKHLQPNG